MAPNDVNLIEQNTRDPSESKDWFQFCQMQFTANMNNPLHEKDSKTSRGF